jgi:DNA modification methylase
LKKDAAWLRPALADYVLVFRKPGENQIAIRPDITNEQWIEWARPIWYGIRESNTLSVVEARSEKDERHICPLQLGVIERCIRLWSNPREIILDPFAGIGSTGFEAIRLERKSISIELKKEYFDVMIKNLERAGNMKKQGRLF